MRNPRSRLSTLTVLAALLTACAASMKPAESPPEYTAAPADTPLWHGLEDALAEDWHVLLNDGPTALDWRLRAIDSATDSIDLQTFLWEFDTVGAMVLDHLVAAADRGVVVRLLIDDTFLLGEDEMLLALHRHPNIEYRVFNPYKRRASGFMTRQVLNLAEFHRLDHRMHNKAMVIDNRVAIVGGRNLADEYFGLHGTANFRDMELLMGGPGVLAVSGAFDDYWNDPWSFPIDSISRVKPSDLALEDARRVGADQQHVHAEETAGERALRWRDVVAGSIAGRTTLYIDKPPEANPADEASAPVQLANELIALLDGARHEILIISAYLIPTPHLEGAVERAAARGVRVRILTNSIRSNNHVTAHSAYRKHIEQLLSHGAELHEVRVDANDRHLYMLSPTEEKALALHAKVLVVDYDKVFVGSANLDPRSLRINTEMGLLVESEDLNAVVRRAVEGDFGGGNAWRLELVDNDSVRWVSDDLILDSQPAASFMQRVEDWLFAHLPIENEM